MDDGERTRGFKGLRLYNTLTGRKENFVPFDPKKVRMYVCGPTVYDFAHIGNARPVIVFDVLFRLLRHLYGEDHVTYVRNITDVDDKIILRAAEEYPELPLNEAIRKVTGTTEKRFHEDVTALGCLEPSVEPRATEHIAEMKAMIEALVEKGFAYVEQEHVLFSVAAMADYGRLSRRSLDDMIAGARVEVAPYKRDPMDFVLWKPSKSGEPAWPSPAGIVTPGRPGWHLECSAMSDRWLWQEALPRLSESARAHPHQFDIHGGGVDLVFPHHENEIAQSRSAYGTPGMAQVWMHNGFLQVEGKKMAKSEGNFVTIRDLLADWPGEVLRFNMLRTHYRQPIDWTVSGLEEAQRELRGWANGLEGSNAAANAIGRQHSNVPPTPATAIVDALRDDLNTPMAIAALRSIYSRSRAGDRTASEELMESCEFLGLLRPNRLAVHNPYFVRSGSTMVAPAETAQIDSLRIAIANGSQTRIEEITRALRRAGVEIEVRGDGSITATVVRGGGLTNEDVEGLLNSRAAARKAKNFAEADRIRDELDAMGIQLKDSKDSDTGELVTTWEVKR